MGGAANWRETAGVVTIRCPGSPEIVVRMDVIRLVAGSKN